MTLFLEETNFLSEDFVFNFIVENDSIHELIIENVDFLGTKFFQQSPSEFKILKSKNNIIESSLKIIDHLDPENIYSLEWQTNNNNSFTLLSYIKDIEIFINKKQLLEDFFNCRITSITRSPEKQYKELTYTNFKDACLTILKNQETVMSPNFLYFLFEDFLTDYELLVLKRMSFI